MKDGFHFLIAIFKCFHMVFVIWLLVEFFAGAISVLTWLKSCTSLL